MRFAVALVSNPDLLVLDEPTVAMDVESRREFWANMRTFARGGKTVVFATHYLEEADAYADRIILMARGGSSRTARRPRSRRRSGCGRSAPPCPTPTSPRSSDLPGVNSADRHGTAVILHCADSDAALRALLPACPHARDIEVTGAGLEDASCSSPATTEEATA